MKKITLILFIYFINHSVFAAETKKAYFAGGCFWCMEESYDKVDGVLSSIPCSQVTIIFEDPSSTS